MQPARTAGTLPTTTTPRPQPPRWNHTSGAFSSSAIGILGVATIGTFNVA